MVTMVFKAAGEITNTSSDLTSFTGMPFEYKMVIDKETLDNAYDQNSNPAIFQGIITPIEETLTVGNLVGTFSPSTFVQVMNDFGGAEGNDSLIIFPGSVDLGDLSFQGGGLSFVPNGSSDPSNPLADTSLFSAFGAADDFALHGMVVSFTNPDTENSSYLGTDFFNTVSFEPVHNVPEPPITGTMSAAGAALTIVLGSQAIYQKYFGNNQKPPAQSRDNAPGTTLG